MASDYSARAVRSDEVDSWGALCARGFAHRGGAVDRFSVRFLRDPSRRLDWLRVTVTNDGRFVGSVRLFDRRQDVDGSSVQICGVGEVCVDPEFRGKGVSSVALPDAMNVIEASGAPIALLHAAEGVQSLYAKYGFQSLPPISYARLQLDAERSISPPPGVMIRVVVADTADTSALAVVREAFQRRIGVTGFIGRPQAAWAGLVSLVGQLVLATADDGSILAYAIIAKKNGYRIGDFGAADSVSPEAAHAMLVSAARMAIDADISVARAGGPDGAAATPVDSAVNSSIVAPLAILRWLVPAAKPLSDAADGGWMVRATLASGDEGLRVCTALTTAAAEGRFLLVSADGF